MLQLCWRTHFGKTCTICGCCAMPLAVFGWLYHTFGEPWKVYHSPDKDEGSECGQLVKIFSKSLSAGAQHLRPESTDVAKALSEGTERHGESEYGGRTTWW